MRLIHVFSGLLAIIGAAFLFGTAHALIREPVSIAPPPLNVGDGNVKGAQNREPEVEPEIVGGGENESETEPTDMGSEKDRLLDAPVPEGMLTLRESYSLWEQGAYFLDARHEHEFEAGHIEYAAWLPATLFDSDSDRAFEVVDSMPMDATVVIYCVGGECDASKNTASRLHQIGFTDLRVMGSGYEDWVQAGLPIETGVSP